MAKPIFIIKLPHGSESERISKELRDKMPDYYVLVVEGLGNNEAEFQCFYEKDMTDIKFDELKNLLKEIKK